MSVEIGSSMIDDNGVFWFSVNDDAELKSAFKEILKSDVGKKYKKGYFDEDRDDTPAIGSQAVRMNGREDDLVNEALLTRALELLMDANEIPKKRPPVLPAAPIEQVVDTTPRDKNGKALTAAQLAWSEMTNFANTASVDAINQRKHTNTAFLRFVQTNMRREMQSQEVGDAVTPAGQPEKNQQATQVLRDFVDAYNVTPIADLKPRNGMVHMAGEQVPVATFNSLLARASNAGLI